MIINKCLKCILSSGLIFLIAISFSSCGIIRKNNAYGCPTGGANVGAERILAGEKAAIKKSRESKFKVKNTIIQ